MAPPKSYRALVADDEKSFRLWLSEALSNEGFICDTADNGEAAARMAATVPYDALVSSLRLPVRTGYELVRDLLKVDDRPLLILHAGPEDKKLVADLVARGVDHVAYKPVATARLATKVRAMLERRPARVKSQPASGASSAAALSSAAPPEAAASGSPPSAASEPVTLAQLALRLSKISSVLPVSHAAFDVYQMTRSCDWRVSQISAAIQRDAALAAEVLRLANSAFYSPMTRRVVNLDDAVMAIGQKRIGELAVTVNALAAVTPDAVPWMNLEVAWKRSLAAGIAIEALIETGGHQKLEEGLPLSAVMYPLGRIVLAMMFPAHYEGLIAQAQRSGKPLQELERGVLPLTHSATLAQLLSTWRIPSDVALPLRNASDEFASLARLPEPLRTKTELVKIAVILGRLAVDQWESWDRVELPPSSVLERLKITNVELLVASIRADVIKLAGFRPGYETAAADAAASAADASPEDAAKPAAISKPPDHALAYCNLSPEHNDLLAELLPSMGFQAALLAPDELREWDLPVIINGLESQAANLAAIYSGRKAVVVTTRDNAPAFANLARTVALSSSYGSLRDAVKDVARTEADESAASQLTSEPENRVRLQASSNPQGSQQLAGG